MTISSLTIRLSHAAQELLAIMTAEKCKMMDRIHCIKEEL